MVLFIVVLPNEKIPSELYLFGNTTFKIGGRNEV